MAYRELIKNFETIRDYMRQFYVYGFKSREEYQLKSPRSYDNERRRVESWLGDYLSFHQDGAGKNVYLSVDSRRTLRNPLYKAFGAKSFTSKDITLHFYLMDLLAEGEAMTAKELVDAMEDRYLSAFRHPFSLDESTVRKKLKEYEALGLLTARKEGRSILYQRTDHPAVPLASWADALSFFSEEAPLGVIGSFLLDRLERPPSYFRFKHHYILHALDSEILCALLTAIQAHRRVTLVLKNLQTHRETRRTFCPLKIYASTQTGRQYVMGFSSFSRPPLFFRIDSIHQVLVEEEEGRFSDYEALWSQTCPHLWGVSSTGWPRLEHIEMTLRLGPGEEYLFQRLVREKRNGSVVRLDPSTCQFTAQVYDASEMIPWLRTFLGHIVDLRCSNPSVTALFQRDLEEMETMYGGDLHAL